MNVLIVTLHYLNGVGGGVFASRAYINAFAELFPGQITLVYPSGDGHDVEGISSDVKLIPVEDKSIKAMKLFNLIRGHVHRNFKILPRLLRKQKYDLVVFDNSRVSYKMIDIAHKAGAKVVTIHHNCELEYNRDNSSRYTKPVILHWTKCYEGDAVRKSDISLVLTPEDKILLTEKYQLSQNIADKIKLLGVFESSRTKQSLSHAQDAPKALKNFIITGNLGAMQSNDSIIEWLKLYYPHLISVFPDATLTIAGKNPSSDLTTLCEKLKINLIPSPESMQPLLDKADCYICPTALGGGLKLRIMDGLKTGLPVITHAVSARGYHEFVKSWMLYSYDDINSFIKCCQTIRTRQFDRSQIISKYRNIFSFEAGCTQIKDIISQIGLQLIEDNECISVLSQ